MLNVGVISGRDFEVLSFKILGEFLSLLGLDLSLSAWLDLVGYDEDERGNLVVETGLILFEDVEEFKIRGVGVDIEDKEEGVFKAEPLGMDGTVHRVPTGVEQVDLDGLVLRIQHLGVLVFYGG